ncbi:MAG: cytochrome c oxidase assembly protein [Fulvimonas sp.]|nr:cytochrome c oxidase assembly protein [Fulvimonas sp.]
MSWLLKWIEPWEFSWTLLCACVLAAVLYARGCRRLHVSGARRAAFWSGLGVIYLSLHTYLDFYAEHEFFMHRLQQLLLHHLAPLLIVAGYPRSVLRAGLPLSWRARGLRRLERSRPWQAASAVLFNPLLATVLFIAFVLIWLIPPLQTLAMLDWRVYRFMNWSMLLSGFIYWSLVLDHRPHPPARMPAGLRVLSPAITMTPQIVAGAVVALAKRDLYPIFEICGRAFTFNVLTGQMVGGLIIWIPAAMVEVAGSLLALRHWLRLSRRSQRHAPPRQAPVAGAALTPPRS